MTQERTFFAVASLGKNRWYWVVWPSLHQLQMGEAAAHVADGICPTKVDAVDAALAVAGLHGEWLAAKYAKAHYQIHRASKAVTSTAQAQPLTQEFLYNDWLDPDSKTWRSKPYRVVKKSRRYIYIEQRPYRAGERTGSWHDYHAKTFRLDRRLLEQEGYATLPLMEELQDEIVDPLFFTTPLAERAGGHDALAESAFSLLGLSPPYTVAAVKSAYRRQAKQLHPDRGGDPAEFLKLQRAYQQALLLCMETAQK